MPRFLIALCIALIPFTPVCGLELPLLISDGMVVQRDAPIPVWGRAEAGERIRVRFDGQAHSVVADAQGRWRIELAERPAGGPHSLVIEAGEGAQTRTVNDIWVGDVWVCSGQSNMEWPLASTEDAPAVIESADDGLIRHFKIPKSWASEPQQSLQGGVWQAASPETGGHFTAVGYYFAQRIRSEVDVPVGLIDATWGGSSIESWMDASLLGVDPTENSRNLREMAAREAREAEAVVARVNQWPGALDANYDAATADWSPPDLDESDWVEIEVPALWEEQGFSGLDGVAWYRMSFDLEAGQTGHDLELGLARIDDYDITSINGIRVGETEAYADVRRYVIGKDLLCEGRNTLAVRVLDTGGGGGIYSEPELLFVRGPGVELSLAGTWRFKFEKGSINPWSHVNQEPAALYNAMLHPLFQVPVRGILWYQGEANANAADQAWAYRDQFRAMITDWRARWGDDRLPFYWVQLANYRSGADTAAASPWAILRESQTEALKLPHTGQAVIIDVGDPNDIHPRDKRTVGNRLARHALRNDYGFSDLVADGPQAVRASVSDGAVAVTFRATGSLQARDEAMLRGFEIADGTGNWHPARVRIDGFVVELRSDWVSQPVAVRYAWSDNPEDANLTDASGLPANPFRISDH